VDDVAQQISQMRALAHPVRLRILSLLTGAELSAAEIARELDITHANASYHLRFLADAGAVEVASEQKIRGGVAKRYRHPWERDLLARGPRGRKPTAEDTAAYVGALGRELQRRFALRRKGARSCLTDAEMWVTPEVWAKVTALVEEAATLIHAEAKTPRNPGTVHVNMTAAVFEMTDAGRG
jgi:DNA-binding transcriptional ArsR family regulator